ncbi:MAG: hypothetical protein ITF98_06820 [Fermentimonas sp.]|nr:hypothetical protein [Fermentimonas sp.]
MKSNYKKKLSTISVKILGKKNAYKLRYFRKRKKLPNLKNPSDLSERLIASILSPDFEKYAYYTDKVEVRNYVQNKGLDRILLEHYGNWEDPKDINLSLLPNKFILKTNNGSGNHVICKDKATFNLNEAIIKLNNQLEKKYLYELHYNAIKPKVFCEELIDTGSDSWPTDYKFTCINGNPYDIFVATERETKVRYSTFDMNWNHLPYTKKEFMPEKLPEKPSQLSDMISIAKTLSKDFEFVRVDLYEYKDKVYFSELTFSPWGGIMHSYTNKAIEILGEKFDVK